jgi:hypothetical protein
MLRFQLDFKKMQTMFFDRSAVKSKVDTRTRKVLSKFGSFVRQTARKSMRKRKGVSKPGNPPFSHTGLLKKFLFFGYDANRRSVVIGPVMLPGKKGRAPSVLEHGGRITLPRGNTADVAPRPFMQPAFEKELPKAAGLWANSVK